MRLSVEPANSWPLPGEVSPSLSPCAFCRRRLRVDGEPVFTNCSCKHFGPQVTIGALALGAAVLVGVGVLLLQKGGRKARN